MRDDVVENFSPPASVDRGIRSHERTSEAPVVPQIDAIRLHMAQRVYSVLDEKGDAEDSATHVECRSETGKLHSVIIGYPDNMMLGGTREVINATQEENLKKGLVPTPEQTVVEFVEFKRVLEEQGVKVMMPKYADVQEQVYSRDIGFVVGDIFLFPEW